MNALFTAAMTLREVDPGVYPRTFEGELDKHWTIGPKVHGGAMLALCANAARIACGGQPAGLEPVLEPIAVSASFRPNASTSHAVLREAPLVGRGVSPSRAPARAPGQARGSAGRLALPERAPVTAVPPHHFPNCCLVRSGSGYMNGETGRPAALCSVTGGWPAHA